MDELYHVHVNGALFTSWMTYGHAVEDYYYQILKGKGKNAVALFAGEHVDGVNRPELLYVPSAKTQQAILED